jgi:carboxyl-terminal processing protease
VLLTTPKFTRCVLAIIASLALASSARAEPEPAAKAYLDEALELIRLHHRDSAQSDWPKIVADAETAIVDAKVPQDTYPAIWRVLGTLGERHSFFIPATRTDAKPAMKQGAPAQALMPSWRLEGRRFGVLSLPGLNTFNDPEGKKAFEYRLVARNGLTQMDKSKICGWIIDLRENDGGNMWPMLAGLDPLLGPSPFGEFPEANGRKEKWVRAHGNIYPTAETVTETPPHFQLKHGNAPVAVLVGPRTASSGEMTAIAFVGRKDTRLFGSPTAGFTSANKTFMLSDGAALVLTAAGAADRMGREYVGPIIPDEQVADDKLMPAAIKWLKKNC